MVQSFTTANYSNLKGYIAEIVAEFHFTKMNYSVIPLGNEKISGLLPSISSIFKNTIVEEGTYDSNTFNVLRAITEKLPDFVIWKLASSHQSFYDSQASFNNTLKISFVEVKYRQALKNREFIITENDDELRLFKYISHINDIFKNQNGNNYSMSKIDFYVYLLTCENERHKILFGKVLDHTDYSFRLNLYDSVKNDFNLKTGNKWDEFNDVSEFILLDSSRKLNELFDKNYIYSLKNMDEASIKAAVFERLNKV